MRNSDYLDKVAVEVVEVYMSDVGLLSAKMMVSASTVLSDINFAGEAKDAITENYVAQELVENGAKLYYWTSDSIAEVDFILQTKNGVISVECKSNERIRSRGLNVCVEKYKPEYSIRISGKILDLKIILNLSPYTRYYVFDKG